MSNSISVNSKYKHETKDWLIHKPNYNFKSVDKLNDIYQSLNLSLADLHEAQKKFNYVANKYYERYGLEKNQEFVLKCNFINFLFASRERVLNEKKVIVNKFMSNKSSSDLVKEFNYLTHLSELEWLEYKICIKFFNEAVANLRRSNGLIGFQKAGKTCIDGEELVNDKILSISYDLKPSGRILNHTITWFEKMKNLPPFVIATIFKYCYSREI
ncbi:MAG: hypothetical protein JHC93_04465 [Parachlamydiales bacterium]|nr:hypothetical protein [Parachlamydiales bacterium]